MRAGNGEGGSAAVELAILALPVLMLVSLVELGGRVSQAEVDVARAASEAARAASLRQVPGDAAAAAREVAAGNLAASGVACASYDVAVDTSDFGPGGIVAVTVRCVASMADVEWLGVPEAPVYTSTSVEPIDRYRAGEPS